MKKIKKLIDEHCRNKGVDENLGLNELLDYLLELFDISWRTDGTGFIDHTIAMKAKSEQLFEVCVDWLGRVTKAIDNGTWIDYFGELYESQYQSKGKASSLGQFFTPASVSDLMVRIITNEEKGIRKVNDCACGSGRLLLAHFAANNYKHDYYIAEDMDIMSVKMCALNMMAHGMIGRVVRHDTLKSPLSFDCGFEINEVRYPIPTTLHSVRKKQVV